MEKHNHLPLEVTIMAQLADLKQVDYKNTLLVSALIEVLIEKGIFSREELHRKMIELDTDIALTLGAGEIDSRHPRIKSYGNM